MLGKKKYVKCPVCEINYIEEGEEMCDICKDNRKDNSLVNSMAYEEQKEQEKLAKYYKDKEGKKSYLSLRYNRNNK